MTTRTETLDTILRLLPALQQRVMQPIIDSPAGLTDEEIADVTRLRESTSRARRVELREAGLIVDSGRRRETRSGRRAIVWVPHPVRFPATRRTCDGEHSPVETLITRPDGEWIKSICTRCGRFLGYRRAAGRVK